MSDTALRFESISVAIAGREILRDVNLVLRRGEILALAGCNGAGKTTLLRVASRVLRPDAGQVFVAEHASDALSRRELARRIAVVPQDVQVVFPFLADEVVLMGRSPHLGAFGYESRADVERARDAMARVGIEDLAGRSMLDLSGGERQLVLIARALAQDPAVLLLDEPTAHLDLRHRVQVLALVREFARSGRSALVVSHDLGLAARTSDAMALLADGGVLATGAPGAVLTRENLRAAFGIEADVWSAPDGAPLVVPRA
ncbi:MAG: ABC transporter ATP-binding protein [Myxococcota bacterium]